AICALLKKRAPAKSARRAAHRLPALPPGPRLPKKKRIPRRRPSLLFPRTTKFAAIAAQRMRRTASTVSPAAINCEDQARMNMSHSALFYLNQGICYQRYGDFVYLRHIDAQRDYLFNGVVYDILRCFSQKEGRTKEEAEAALLERYSLSDRESFRREMDAFLERLTDEGILRTDQAHACADLPAVL